MIYLKNNKHLKTTLVLSGGILGHKVALSLKRKYGKKHRVVVITPNSMWNWIPSNIWVGVGSMSKADVTFPVAPIYKKQGIEYHQAKTSSIHPNGSQSNNISHITVEYTSKEKSGQMASLNYDYLVNATGSNLDMPKDTKLNLNTDGAVSVCTPDHANQAFLELKKMITKLKQGERATVVIGTGHGAYSYHEAAIEYLFNIEQKLCDEDVRKNANIIYIGGVPNLLTESLLTKIGITWITDAHIERVKDKKIFFKQLNGAINHIQYDFSMFIPALSGVGLTAIDKTGKDMSETLFKPHLTCMNLLAFVQSYSHYGRNLNLSFNKLGFIRHLFKSILHSIFIYKVKARPFWWLIPE